jgi:membrane fusion protein, multidrug efflux system
VIFKTAFKASIIFIGCIIQIAGHASSQNIPINVVTKVVQQGDIITQQNFIGSLKFREQSLIASRAAGLVQKIYFDTTHKVVKGQLLVELDHEVLDLNINTTQSSMKEIKIQLEKVTKDLKRYDRLLGEENVSEQQYDEVFYSRSSLEQKLIGLEAELNILNIKRKQHFIRAPFNGMITQKKVALGEWVEEGGTIAMLIDPTKIDAYIDIPMNMTQNLPKKVNLTIQGKSIKADVIGIIIIGDKNSRTVPLKIQLNEINNHMYESMDATLQLPIKQFLNTLIVPRDAIIKRFNQQVVFAVKNKKAVMIPVTVKLFKNTVAAVQAEQLKKDMKVIVKGNERIFPGQSVTELQSSVNPPTN